MSGNVKLDANLEIDPNNPALRKVKQEVNLENSLARMKNTVAILSGKGGVGKSTVAINLAVSFAKKGYKVGLIDADITGPSIPLMAGLYGKDAEIANQKIVPTEIHGVKIISMDLLLRANTPVIWRGPLKMAAIKQFLSDVAWDEDIDILFIDLPPGTSDEPLSISQMFENITGTVIVTTPQLVSVHDVKKSINFASAVKMPVIGLIENMSGLECPHCSKEINLFSRGGGRVAASELGINFLGEIPLDPQAVIDGDEGTPSALKDGKFKIAFESIVDKIRTVINIE